LDAFRKKRNVSNYDIGGGISDREVQQMTPLQNLCATTWNTGFVPITRRCCNLSPGGLFIETRKPRVIGATKFMAVREGDRRHLVAF